MRFRSQVNWIFNHLEVNPKKDTDILEIKFQAGSPHEAMNIINNIIDNFISLNKELNKAELIQLRRFRCTIIDGRSGNH